MGQQTSGEVIKLALNSLTQVKSILSILMVQGGFLHIGDLFPTFKRKEVESEYLYFSLGFSQVTLIQNNQYVIEMYFGAACPGPQQVS